MPNGTMQRSSLVKDTLIYSLGAFLIKAFGFFLIPVYTRFLTVEEYGVLALLSIILQFVSFVLLLGVSSAAMRFYFDGLSDADYQRRVYGNALIILLIFPGLLLAFALPIGKSLAPRFLPSIPFFPYIFVIFLIGLCNPIQRLVLGLMRVRRQAVQYIAYSVSLFLLQTGAIILAVVWWKAGIRGIVYAQLAANAVFWGIGVAIVGRYAKFSFSTDIAKRLLYFGLPLIPFFIFIWINDASGRFMLERYSNLRDLGIFALALQFSHMLGFLSRALENSMLPFFYETAQLPKASEVLGNFATNYFVLFGLAALFTLVVAQPLVLIAADTKFHEATTYIPIIILAGWLEIVFNIFYWNLMHSKRTQLISALLGASAVLMVGMLFLLLKTLGLGIRGAVLAMVVIALLKDVAGYFLSQHYFKLKYSLPKIVMSSFLLVIAGLIIY
ncbi:MAG: oligosaccharide flippase family protein, partial [Candidatus Aminicenantales bacterium]